MQDLADFILDVDGLTLAASPPLSGDRTARAPRPGDGAGRKLLTFGLTGPAVRRLGAVAGRNATLRTNDGRELAKLTLIKVDPSRALLVAELSRSG